MSKRYGVKVVRDDRKSYDPDRAPYAIVDLALSESHPHPTVVERFHDRISAEVECARMNRENP